MYRNSVFKDAKHNRHGQVNPIASGHDRRLLVDGCFALRIEGSPSWACDAGRDYLNARRLRVVSELAARPEGIGAKAIAARIARHGNVFAPVSVRSSTASSWNDRDKGRRLPKTAVTGRKKIAGRCEAQNRETARNRKQQEMRGKERTGIGNK
jgi:hypothetical protein